MPSQGKPIDLSRYTDDDGQRIVTAISVIGVPTYPKKANPRGGAHLVHWRVHLRWAGKGGALAKGSVALDTYKDDELDPIVKIDVYSKTSLVSTSASKHWEFTVPVTKESLTVQTVVDLITSKGRERYKYDGNGSGCLSWSMKLLGDYVTAGYVASEVTKNFEDFIAAIRNNERSYWVPDDQGTYI